MADPLRDKTCAWCDQDLTHAARGHCGALHERAGCWWVPMLKEHGAAEALRRAREAKDG